MNHPLFKRLFGSFQELGLNLRQRSAADSRFTATIANGAAITGNLSCARGGPRGLVVVVPDVWDTADIGFEVYNGANWAPLYNDVGNRVTISNIATTTRRAYIAPAAAWAVGCWPQFRLVSLNTGTGAEETQGGNRALFVGFLG